MQNNIHPVDLLTSDLYQFTCSYSYFLSNKHNQIATFEVFFRKAPFNGQYAILAGISSVKHFINTLKFTNQHQQFLRSNLTNLSNQYFQWIKQDFKDKVQFKSMKEGQIVFPKQPLISWTGPLAFAQLLQTPILNLLGFATLVATNASRMVKAVYPKKCLEFGVRRAQGPDGGLSASHYSYLGGFAGTSNMQAAMKLGIPCVGTMSHAYVTSFKSLDEVDSFRLSEIQFPSSVINLRKQLGIVSHDGELAAFIIYLKAFPNNFTTLIDTYNTLQSGLMNTILISKIILQIGIKNIGVRLDSGDLCHYSKECRKIWNHYIPNHKLNIIASDDLHEERLIQLENNASQIDVYAIGTNIATCKKQPALGLVCKLVQLDHQAKIKFSEDQSKSTLPAKKSVYRIWINNKASLDLISLQGQQIKQSIIIVDITKPNRKYKISISKKQVLNSRWNQNPTLKQTYQYMLQSRKQLNTKIFNLKEPKSYPLFVTEAYNNLFRKIIQQNCVIQQWKDIQ